MTSQPANATSEDILTRKLFVGNIGYRQTWKNLKDFFSKFGAVNYTSIVQDHLRKRSQGIGFVEFATREAADLCLAAPESELTLEGRILRVNYAIESGKKTFTKYPPIPQVLEESAEKVGEQKSDILTLDVWRIILSFLTLHERVRLERVCKNWRHFSLEIWKEQKKLVCNGFSMRRLLTDKVLTSLLSRCGQSLLELDLCVPGQVLTEYAMTVIGHYCPRLTKLNISGVKATNTGMRDLSNSIKQLRWISIYNCQYIAEKGVWWLLKNCEKLENLDISANHSITGKCFFLLKSALKHLNGNKCYKLTDYAIEQLSNKCRDLTELDIYYCVSLTDVSILAISMLSQLQILNIGGTFPKVTSSEPWLFLGQLHELKELYLDENPHITDDVVLSISSGCPKLRTLSLIGCRSCVTSGGLLPLSMLASLTSLDVSYIQVVDDEFLLRLASRGQLEKLWIRSCLNVTEEGVQQVLEMCSRLVFLDLSNIVHLTNMCLDSLNVNPSSRQHSLPLQIVVGGTAMCLEVEAGQPIVAQLPEWLTLNRCNSAKPVFCHDGTIHLPQPWDSSDEDEEEWKEEPQVEHEPLEGMLAMGAAIDEPHCGEDHIASDNQGSPGKNHDLAGLGDEAERGAETGIRQRHLDLLWAPEEEWVAEEGEVPVPVFQRQVQPELFLPIGEYGDCNDFEDYDEFLDNDDPLAMERWNKS